MLEVCNLCHSFGEKVVLKDLNFTIRDGSVVGLVGVNGAGKSTLLRILSGVYDPISGSVSYDGRSAREAVIGQEIFFLPDDPYYAHRSTPMDIFNMYAVFYPQIDKTRFLSLISAYEIPENKPMRNFSKGMRRQVFIAISLAIAPRYLLMDEAFDGLDPLSRKIFKDAISNASEERKCTVLVSSHALRELEAFCDSYIMIDSTAAKHYGASEERSEKLCKFEMAFTEFPNKELFEGLPVVSLSINGHFVQVVLSECSDKAREQLSSLHPAVMDERSVDFEEAFIYDAAREGVDL